MSRKLALILVVSLSALWLLWSGLYKPLILALGAASVALVVLLVRRFETLDHESVPAHLGWAVIPYWGWLLKEIVVSSWSVTRIVLAPKLNISPRVVRVQSLSTGQVGQVTFANSITLTPGTLTLDVDDAGWVTVHALTAEGADGVLHGDMNGRVARLTDASRRAGA